MPGKQLNVPKAQMDRTEIKKEGYAGSRRPSIPQGFHELFQLRPELRGKLEQRGNEPLTEGFIRFLHKRLGQRTVFFYGFRFSG